MRRIPKSLLILVFVLALSVVAQAYSFDCGGSSTTLETVNANWVRMISSNSVYEVIGICASLSGTPGIYMWNQTFADDQYSKTWINIDGGPLGAMVRMAADGDDARGYIAYINSTVLVSIYKRSSSTNTLVGTAISTSVANGNTIKITATGSSTTTLEVFINDVSIGTRDDSSSPFTTGKAGLYFAGGWADNVDMGDVGGAPAATPRMLLLGVGE